MLTAYSLGLRLLHLTAAESLYNGWLFAVVNGEQSRLLGEIHISLLRLLQMDLEEAHATGAIQAS